MSNHQPLKDTRGKGESTVAVCEGRRTETQWEVTGVLYVGPTLHECLREATTTGQTNPSLPSELAVWFLLVQSPLLPHADAFPGSSSPETLCLSLQNCELNKPFSSIKYPAPSISLWQQKNLNTIVIGLFLQLGFETLEYCRNVSTFAYFKQIFIISYHPHLVRRHFSGIKATRIQPEKRSYDHQRKRLDRDITVTEAY